jgi:uncharacterized metal-binding protein
MTASSCCGVVAETLVFTCAGAAYSGQVANQSGVQLHREKDASLFCIAAVAAQLPEKLERAQKAAMRIAIDGCGDQCCRLILEKAGLPVDIHVVVTDQGVEKKPEKPRMAEDSAAVIAKVRQALGRA